MPYIGNQHNVGDHVNNFKVLDDISSHTATFDGSATSVVSAADDTIRIPEHRFIQGQRVTYTNGGGGNIGGLTTGTAYFVSFDTANTIKLATTLANANSNTVINLSAVGSGTSHTLNAAFDGVNTKFKMTHSSGKAARLNNATQLNVAINNVIQRPNLDPNNFTDGFALQDNHKIVFKTAPTVNDVFWGSIIANTIENFDLRDNEVDNFTGDGSTTEFTLSTIPANNESVIVSINGVVQHPSDKNTARSYTLIDSIIQFTAAPALGDGIQVRHIGFAGASTNDVSGFYGRTGNVALTSSDHITTGDITPRNINASGIITASSFDGSFSSNVGGSNANFTGIVTAGLFKSGDFDGRNLNISGIATFAGDVSIGGTLTYEDVTNIDSVGIITARNGIDCNGDIDVDGHTNLDHVSVAGVTTFANKVTAAAGANKGIQIGSNLKLTDQANVFIENTANSSMYLVSKGTQIRDRSNNNIASFSETAGSSLFHHSGSTKKLGTSATGINILEDLDVDGHTNLDNVSIAGVTTTTGMVDITGSSFDEGANLTLRNTSAISNDENIANINIVANDGPSGFHTGAQIKFQSGNSWSNSAAYTDIVFKHTKVNSTSLVEALKISGTATDVSNHIAIGSSSLSNQGDYYLAIKGYERSSQGATGDAVNIGVFNQSQATQATAGIDFRLGQAAISNTAAVRLIAGKQGGWTNTASTRDGYFAISVAQNAQVLERFRITSNGRVGVGSISPLATLDVRGSQIISGDLDVDGHTNLDNVSIAGVATVTAAQADVATFTSNQTASTIYVKDTDGDGIFISGSSAYGHRIYTNTTEDLLLGTNSAERLRITSDGEVGISPGSVTPTAGDLQSGDSQNKPLIHVKGNGVSATGGEYNLIGRFEAGGDADNTGAMVVLNHSNDRGLALIGGRATGNNAFAALKMIDNVGRLTDIITSTGFSGQGVANIKFFTGNSTTTTERLRIQDNGDVYLNPTVGSTPVTSGAIRRFNAGLDYWNGTAGSANAIKYAVHGQADDNMYGMGISASLLEMQSQVDIAFFAGGAGTGTGRRVERARIHGADGLFDIANTCRATNFYLRGNGSAPTADASIFRPADNCFAIATSSTERVRVTNDLVNIKGGNLHVGHDSATTNYTDSNLGNTRHIEIGATGGGDALLTTHCSGYGIGYFGYHSGGDRLVIACDQGGGNNSIDLITTAGTSNGGNTDNLHNKNPRFRIQGNGGFRAEFTDSNEVHAISNYDHGNNAYNHRGGRTLTSNGAGWDGNESTDGADPILVLSVANRAGNSDIGDAYGLCLHSESQDNNDYGPLIGWSNRSNSGSYNTTYAAIVGQKTGQAADSNWSSGALHFFTQKPGGYMDSTADLSIDEAGHVLTPRNSRFYAVSNSGASDSADGTTGLISNNFETELVDSNSDFNPSNGRFTAPVDGKYEFHFAALHRTLSSGGGSGELTFYKNGSNLSARSFGYSNIGSGGSSSDHQHLTIHGIFALSAGDYIDVRIHSITSGQDFYFHQGLGYFSGKLLG